MSPLCCDKSVNQSIKTKSFTYLDMQTQYTQYAQNISVTLTVEQLHSKYHLYQNSNLEIDSCQSYDFFFFRFGEIGGHSLKFEVDARSGLS